MPFSEDFKERVKNSIDIVDYIGRDISLHKKNFDDYRGTVGKAGNSGESLIVSPSQQLWHDTKNQCGGDVFSWIAYREGLDKQKDFLEILRIAAEFAGIELEGLTDEDRALIEDGKEVTATLNEVTEIYHQNLLSNPEAIKQVSDNWGFNLEVIKAFKIGYATGADLKHIDKQRLVKAGLIYKNSSQEFFIHRIMFPYLIKGNTVYFIGRRTDKTPLGQDGKPTGKYKKLLTHDNNPDVSKHVNNKFLFGEDNIKGSDWVLIAEGITDAISAQVRGYPVISAVTTSIKKAETDRVSKVIGERPVKICLDIDSVTQAGQNGARLMAEKLTVRGNGVSILSLPDPEGKKDYDLNDYFRKHEKEDFDKLIEEAPDYWDYILPNKETYTSKPVTARLKAFKKFISDDLREMPEELWRAFIENEVVKAFSLTKKDAKAVIDNCEKARSRKNQEDESEEKEGFEPINPMDIDRDEAGISPEEKKQAKEEALKTLKEGDPVTFIVNTVQENHKGDKDAIEAQALAFAGQSTPNTDGIQVVMNGPSGSGKSHTNKSHLHCIPARWKRVTSVTPKAIYHMGLRPGIIILSDDTKINEELEETVKRSTTNFQEETHHATLINGELKELTIPPRTIWLFTNVDSQGSVQLLNRQLTFNTEDTPEVRKEALRKRLKEAEEGINRNIAVTHNVLVAREIYGIVKDQFLSVKIPYAKRIKPKDNNDMRIINKFLDMITGYAIFNFMQRERDEEGFIIADIKDFDNAKRLFEAQKKGIVTKMNENERNIMMVLSTTPGGADINTISDKTGIPVKNLYRIINGRSDRPDEGLMGKIKGLRAEKVTEKYDAVTKTKTIYKVKDLNIFEFYENDFITLLPEGEEV